MATSISNIPCSKCGNDQFKHVKNNMSSERDERNDAISVLYLVCTRCGERRIKQKIRLYYSEEVLENVEFPQKQQNSQRHTPGNGILVTYNRRSTDR